MKQLLTMPIAVAATLVATALASANSGYPYPYSYPAPSPARLTSAAKGTTVSIAKTSLGRILVDSRGRTLYLFERDKSRVSTCYSSCASIWPPVITKAKPRATRGAAASRIGSWKRKDGTIQVTYNGHPLYYYAGDTKAGQIKGQGLDQFGAGWYVLSAAGMKLEKSGS